MISEKKNILYVTYDGVLEPLGQSQVVAYLTHLVIERRIILVSFEKKNDWNDWNARNSVENLLKKSGIKWYALKYHKAPSLVSTVYDVMIGTVVCLYLTLRYRIGIIHARSYVAALIAVILSYLLGKRYIFDMRGFWADERVDGGIWSKNSFLYNTAKWFEKLFIARATYVVSLTYAAIPQLKRLMGQTSSQTPIVVIPTCADLDLFRPKQYARKEFLLGYVGSIGTWYQFDAVLYCFSYLAKLIPKVKFLIINRQQHNEIIGHLNHYQIPLNSVELRSVEHKGVAEQMSRVHAGIFFYKPTDSRVACAPTKLAEFLGCGIPCLSNRGVGDTAELLEGNRVGIIVQDFSSDSLVVGLKRLLSLCREGDIELRCRRVAESSFSLQKGVERYRSTYLSVENTA